MNNLVIVESPAKAKTIKKYLGADFEVLASYGHVRDLVEKEGAVDPANNFAMKYQVIDKSKPKVDAIVRAAKNAGALYLATDPDREGEAISWHLTEILRERGVLEGKELHRVRFYEITKNAIREAVESPDTLNDNLVDAQQARRALDYLVGFNLSPLLWKKIKPGLSAGRVQSVALRLICEREDEITRFIKQEYWTVEADATRAKSRIPARLIEYRGTKFEADAQKNRFSVTNEADALEVERTLATAAGGKLVVDRIEKSQKRRRAAPPFTTSTVQQEAARKLGFTARRTMQAAQKLYEAGFITYMRTDSVQLSRDALGDIRGTIKALYGDKALPETPNFYQTRAQANAQEAHEAIRPTSAARTPAEARREIDDEDQARLYDLVWKRSMASQMTPAVFDTVAVDLVPGARGATGAARHVLRASGQTLVEPGFLAVYREDHDEDETDVESEDEQRLPVLAVDDILTLDKIRPEQHFTQPPPRYTEASLVKSLESHGIGRPSTYASIIDTLRYRKYVEMAGKAFVPTDIGKIVAKFLVKYFTTYVDYDFTARMEDVLDEISNGSKDWRPELERFWTPFKSRCVEIEKGVSREEVAESRELGRDPVTGKPITVRMGQYGPFVQQGTKDDEEKPRFASLMPGQKMDDVTLEDAFKLLSLPRSLGKSADGKAVSVGRGQFGPYVKYGDKFVSIKDDDPFTITLERALELVVAKQAADAARVIVDFGEDVGIRVLMGQWGPYVTDGVKNAKAPKPGIPKDADETTKLTLWRQAAAALKLEECRELLAAAPVRPAKGGWGRGRFGAKKKAAAAAKAAPVKEAAPKKTAAAKKKAAPKKAAAKKAVKKTVKKKAANTEA
ncbi:MAG: type I DNA topoisomerase [Gammaproteobacteria bacterium]|nr:type I DNA topoisomerase [Gammaproteobacteria bacterium]